MFSSRAAVAMRFASVVSGRSMSSSTSQTKVGRAHPGSRLRVEHGVHVRKARVEPAATAEVRRVPHEEEV